MKILKKSKKTSWLIPIFISLFVFKSSSIPYEKCTYHTKNSDQIIKLSEGFSLNESPSVSEACDDCTGYRINNANSIFSKLIDRISTHAHSIPEECFFSSFLRGLYIKPTQRYYHCKKINGTSVSLYRTNVKKANGNTVLVNTRPFCFNKNYTELIAKSFNEMARCFNFNETRTKQLFALFNHEGSFILNNASKRKARCFGQLTSTAIKEIYRRVRLKDKIYLDAVKKCPNMVQLHPKVTKNSYKEELPKTATCEVTHNPYKCTFYSMFNAAINYKELESLFNNDNVKDSTKELKGDRSISEISISLNEVLHMKGLVNKKKVNWIFNSTQALRYTFRNKPDFDLKAREAPIFDKQSLPHVIDMVALWAYNGGISAVKNNFIAFMKDFKEQVSKPLNKCSKPYCNYRKKLLTGQSLKPKEFKRLFKKFLRIHYPSRKISRKKEVAYFLNNIKKDTNALNKNLNQYLSAYKLHKKNNGTSFKNFKDTYNKKCKHVVNSIEDMLSADSK